VSENARLSVAETMVLCGDMEHSPDCEWTHRTDWCYVDAQGAKWQDEDHTIPHVPLPCACGYFALLDSARAKLRATLANVA
jgi:hypothetical protein